MMYKLTGSTGSYCMHYLDFNNLDAIKNMSKDINVSRGFKYIGQFYDLNQINFENYRNYAEYMKMLPIMRYVKSHYLIEYLKNLSENK